MNSNLNNEVLNKKLVYDLLRIYDEWEIHEFKSGLIVINAKDDKNTYELYNNYESILLNWENDIEKSWDSGAFIFNNKEYEYLGYELNKLIGPDYIDALENFKTEGLYIE